MPGSEDTIESSRQIQNMFTVIAPQYDFLNGLLSIGRDSYWRRVAIDRLAPKPGEHIVDIATGTGDMVIEIASRNGSIRVSGIDFSRPMLERGRIKVMGKGYGQIVSFQIGNGECLPFAEKSFDGAVCAFGIRNFLDVKLGLMELYRVLKPGGRAVILEFSMPTNPIFNCIYNFYFDLVLPKIGKFISGHDNAYNYLHKSVIDFPDQMKFMSWLKEAGFQNVSFNKLTLGIVSIHYGYKGF